MKELRLWLWVVGLVFVLGGNARAEEPVLVSEDEDGNLVQPVATVNVWNVRLIKQEGRTLHIAFDIFNRTGIQPAVMYSVNLLRSNPDGSTVLVDRFVADEKLSLIANQTINKDITYTAPATVTDEQLYRLEVQASNPDGLPLGSNEVAQIVHFEKDVTGPSVNVDPKKCSLGFTNGADQKSYFLDQGIDMDVSEALTMYCTVVPHQAIPRVAPVFEIRRRSPFGEVATRSTGTFIELDQNKSSQVLALAVPVPKSPQAYDGSLVLINQSGEKISPRVEFHFVVRGQSATIQNITLDKDAYRAGETAVMKFFWTGSAEDFIGSRKDLEHPVREATLQTLITNGSGQICAEQKDMLAKDASESQSGLKDIKLPIKRECLDPKVDVRVLNKSGQVLAENQYTFVSSGRPTTMQKESFFKRFGTWGKIAFGLVAGGCLLLLVVGGLWYRRRSRTLFPIWLLLGLWGVMLGGVDTARADTFVITANFPGTNHIVTTTFEVNINAPWYYPNQTITAKGKFVSSTCNNGREYGAGTAFLSATNKYPGGTSYSEDVKGVEGYKRGLFLSPSTVTQNGRIVFTGGDIGGSTGNYKMSYSMMAAPVITTPTPPSGSCGPAARAYGVNETSYNEASYGFAAIATAGNTQPFCNISVSPPYRETIWGNYVDTNLFGPTAPPFPGIDGVSTWYCGYWNGSCSVLDPNFYTCAAYVALATCTATRPTPVPDTYTCGTANGAPTATAPASNLCSKNGTLNNPTSWPTSNNTNPSLVTGFEWTCGGGVQCFAPKPATYLTICEGGQPRSGTSGLTVEKDVTKYFAAILGPIAGLCSGQDVTGDTNTTWTTTGADGSQSVASSVSNGEQRGKPVTFNQYPATAIIKAQYGGVSAQEVKYDIACNTPDSEKITLCGGAEKLRNTCAEANFSAQDPRCNKPVSCRGLGGRLNCGGGYQEVAP